jgi:hypothetical protein
MREVNDRIAEFAPRFDGGGQPFDFLCECAEVECVATVTMTLDDYTKRAGAGWVLVEGHSASSEQQVA